MREFGEVVELDRLLGKIEMMILAVEPGMVVTEMMSKSCKDTLEQVANVVRLHSQAKNESRLDKEVA